MRRLLAAAAILILASASSYAAAPGGHSSSGGGAGAGKAGTDGSHHDSARSIEQNCANILAGGYDGTPAERRYCRERG
jgi:hypothetical protein